MERHSVARLIGAPPGYVGYEEGGRLTEAIRRRPYSVILLDEIEKAHRDVFNILLQVLDDGRLTDGHGRTVDFKNTVLIMTSNIGSQYIAAASERARHDGRPGIDEATRQQVMDALRQHFLPEFLNRVDEVILFHNLSREHIAKIVEIQLRRLCDQLRQQGLELEVTDAAKRQLAEEGYDPVYGARPLKRVIQQRIQNPLASQLLEGSHGERNAVRVDWQEGRFTFEFFSKEPAEAAVA
jgi:ATP-dependent Clp protease ATP-binding subunit ClpB